MNTKYICIAISLGLGAIAAACSDDKTYEPGPAVEANCMGVYFDADNEHEFIFVPGEESVVTVKMHRVRTSEAADVPLVCTSTLSGVNFPASVHFDAGSADAEARIDCSGLPTKEIAKISVFVPDQYIDLYSEQLFCYETTALVSQWQPANADGSPVTIYFTETDYNYYNTYTVQSSTFAPIECEMEVLPGASRIRIHNFLNTGSDIDLSFSPSPYSDYEGYYRVLPINHYATMNEVYESTDYGDDWYNPWYLLIDSEEEEDEEDYAVAELTSLIDGSDVDVEYPMFYSYSNSYLFEYSYAVLRSSNEKYNSISMGFSGSPVQDVTFPSYFYIFFRWTGDSGL